MNLLRSIGRIFLKMEPDYIVYLRHEYRGKVFTVKVYRHKIDYFGKAEYKIRVSSIPWDIKCGYEKVPDEIANAYSAFEQKINNVMLVDERENDMIRKLVDVQLKNPMEKIK